MNLLRTNRIVKAIAALQLLFSSVMHFLNPMYFYGTVLEYQILGIGGSKYVVALLPMLQFIVGILLLSHPGAKELHAIVFGIGILFISVQSLALIRDLKIDCGCFGTFNSQPIGLVTLASAAMLAICGLANLLMCKRLDSGRLPQTSA